MELKSSTIFKDIYDVELKNRVKSLIDFFNEEYYKGNKVAFLYKDEDNTISYNEDICFYAASTIKILAVLLMFKRIDEKVFDLNDNILITMDDLKQDSGVIKYQKEDTYYTLEELLRLTIVESDNTAYLKIVSLLGGKEALKEFGNSLGAIHTMEGKATDAFGITNCNDMLIYLENVIAYINLDNENSKKLKTWMLNTTTKKVKVENLNGPFIRKGGEYDVAYHDVGYVKANKPYYLIILTQLMKMDYKDEFINKAAIKIKDINEYIEMRDKDDR